MRRVALLVAVLALLVVPTAVSAQHAAAPAHPDTQIRIAIQESGDARWAVTVRFPLETANDTAAFDRLRAEFTDGGAGYLSAEPFRQAASRVSAGADQEMAITDVQRTADVATVNNTTVGALTLSFTWTNFAVIGEERVRVGDAFEGGWFGDLKAGQTLIIQPPPGYQVHTAEPAHASVNGTLRWEGPQAFGPGEPVMTFVPIPSPPPGPAIPFTAPVFLGIGVVIGVLLFLAYRQGLFTWGSESTTPPDSGSSPEEPGDQAPATGGTAVEAPGGTEKRDETADEPDLELLSDEERVERILEEHGGRMKQAQIVEETRWSNAKVSQLLSSMAEEGRVEKLRLGRENLISLPDDEE
ncbi:MAG: helix-turn-helix transcriptional regulator [Halanaeroarchaeum sp.]